MRKAFALIALISALTLVTTADPLGGFTPIAMQPGAPAGSYALSGMDSVNLFNGHLNFALPLLRIGGRGSAGYTMMLTIERRWRYFKVITPLPDMPTIVSYFADGDWWHAPQGYGPGTLRPRFGVYRPEGCPNLPPGTLADPALQLTRQTFTEPDGTEHELIDEATEGRPQVVPDCHDTVFVLGDRYRSHDGTAMTLIQDATGWRLLMRDGTVHRFGSGPGIRDRNGNTVDFEYEVDPIAVPEFNTRVKRITDSLKRVVNVAYGDSPTGIDLIEYAGFESVPRTIKVKHLPLGDVLRELGWETMTRDELFPPPEQTPLVPPDTSKYNPRVVSEVELPDGRSYKFRYNQWGELSRIELPTGGAFEYDWAPGEGTFNNGLIAGSPFGGLEEAQEQHFGVYRRVIEKRVYSGPATLEGKTRFFEEPGQGSLSVARCDHLTPSDGLISRSRHYFEGFPLSGMVSGEGRNGEFRETDYPDWQEGKEVKTEIIDPDGRVLQRTENQFRQRTNLTWFPIPWDGRFGDNCAVPRCAPPNDVRLVETIATVDPSLPTQKRVSKRSSIDPLDASGQTVGFDEYNNPTDVWEYDFGAAGQSSAGPLIRRTHTDYVSKRPDPDGGEISENYQRNAAIHIRNLPSVIRVYSGTSTQNPKSETKYVYDNYGAGGLISRDNLTGHDSTYDASRIRRGNATKVTNALLPNAVTSTSTPISTTMTYDIAGNVTSVTDARNQTTSFEFNDNFGPPNGQLTDTSRPPQLTPTDKTWAFITRMTNPLNHVSEAQYDYHLGLPVDTVDPNGLVATGYYTDPLERMTKGEVRRQPGAPIYRQMLFAYTDALNRSITTRSDQDSFGDGKLQNTLTYDGLGRTIETRQIAPEGAIRTRQEYDAMGRLFRAHNPHIGTNESTYGTTETRYDALSRPTELKTLDKDGNVTGVVGTIYVGNETTVTDQAGQKRKSTSDALGRLVRVTEDTGGLNYQTDYRYDILDNLVQVDQGSQHRYFLYDSLKRLVRTRNPEQEVNTVLDTTADPLTGNAVWTTGYEYDSNSNLIRKTDALGIRTGYTYDSLNRVTHRDYSDGATRNVSYFYDSPTGMPGQPPAFAAGDSIGKIVGMTYGSGSEGTYMGYDDLGRVNVSIQQTDGVNYRMSYDYNVAGAMISETYPSNKVVQIEYDTVGRTAGVKKSVGSYYAGGSPEDLLNRIGYTPHGEVSRMRLGNGKWEHSEYNSRFQPRLIGLGTSESDSSLLRLEYTYGVKINGTLDITKSNGNVESQKITVPNQSGGFVEFLQRYVYDDLSRLVSASETNGGTWTQTFTYDRWGNRLTTTNSGGGLPAPFTGAPDPATNRIVGFHYDKAGNVVDNGPPTPHFDYDAENRQIRHSGSAVTNYFYDCNGHRVKKEGSDGKTVWVYNVEDRLIAEYTSASVSPVPTSYLTTDHLGSTRLVTDGSGNVNARYDFLPFGEKLNAGSRTPALNYDAPDSTKQLFTQKERDSESGLDYLLARYYSSAQGRFTSVDTFSPTLARRGNRNEESEREFRRYLNQPQHWNQFPYVLNNPLRYVDESGSQELESAEKALSKVRVPGPFVSPVVTQYIVSKILNGIFGPNIETIPNGLKPLEFAFATEISDFTQKTFLGVTEGTEPGIDGILVTPASIVGTYSDVQGIASLAETSRSNIRVLLDVAEDKEISAKKANYKQVDLFIKLTSLDSETALRFIGQGSGFSDIIKRGTLRSINIFTTDKKVIKIEDGDRVTVVDR